MNKNIKEFLLVAVGATLMSAAMYFGMDPHSLAPGGVYGASVVLATLLPFPVGAISLVLNGILFTLAFKFLGSHYGAKTIFATIVFSGALIVFEKLFPNVEPLTDDILLDLLVGTVVSAIGLIIVLNQNASTGGTDIIASIIQKYTGWEFGKALMAVDILITLGASYFFGLKIGLYSLFAVIAYGVVIDYILEGFDKNKEMTIVTSKNEEVLNYIFEDLDRSATLYQAKGAYSNVPKEIIVTVLDRGSFVRLKNFMKDTDPTAFITVNETYEVLGEGYKDLSSQ